MTLDDAAETNQEPPYENSEVYARTVQVYNDFPACLNQAAH